MTASPAVAGPTATNACLAKKLAATASACGTLLRGSAKVNGSATAREARLDQASRMLARRWRQATAGAAKAKASCGDVGPSESDVIARLDAAATTLADDVWRSLSPPTSRRQRRCATRLLGAAGQFCRAWLRAEAKRHRLDGTGGVDVTAALRRARRKLRRIGDAQTRGTCPSTVTATEVEGRIEAVGVGVAISLTRPNILWLVAEDMNRELGVYGDPVARTPNLDRLASEGVRFTQVYSPSGVCAPARTALITGMYPTSIGAHHMRSIDGGYHPVPPADLKALPERLRAAGYYCTNDAKQDYQFSGALGGGPFTMWDESRAGASWRGRAEGQPFFAYITYFPTHESFIFLNANAPTVTDPFAITVPPYYPDTLAVRTDLAHHYDNVEGMDARFGEILADLEADGLADDTLVMFFGDNGRGLPRDKRWIYDGGIQMALLVRWPGRIEPGTVREDLVSFVDFAPTMLAVAGLDVPKALPGRVVLGRRHELPPEYVYAAADRHDEATDRIRAVRDSRFKYIRNYQPDTPYGQSIAFRNNLPTMQEIFRLQDLGMLPPPADWYYRQTKPLEELYDTDVDPFELTNLAADPAHREVLLSMRAAHEQWVTESGDLGAIPEAELAEHFWPGGIQPVTAAPTVSPAGRTFSAPVTVTLSVPTDGASIGFKLGTDTDDASWRLYTRPFVVSEPTTVRSKANRYGWAESDETLVTFAVSSPD
jgi:arylsulfatase A-like enzyme